VNYLKFMNKKRGQNSNQVKKKKKKRRGVDYHLFTRKCSKNNFLIEWIYEHCRCCCWLIALLALLSLLTSNESWTTPCSVPPSGQRAVAVCPVKFIGGNLMWRDFPGRSLTHRKTCSCFPLEFPMKIIKFFSNQKLHV